MGTIVANSIISQAQVILQDTTATRWPSTELLGWLNSGQREITMFKPDSYMTTAPVQLIAGTKQSLPAAGERLRDVIRNLGVSGATPGAAVRIIDREVLDAQVPGWHIATASAVTQHYIFDGRDPKVFYVYPPQPTVSPSKVEAMYESAPADVAINATILIDNRYANALLDYILYRAYLKDAEYAGNNNRARGAYTAFQSSLALSVGIDTNFNPNNNAPPYNPAVIPDAR